jgi:hypothetical protein
VRTAANEKSAVLRRIRGWQAAAAKEREFARRQGVPSANESLAHALELNELAGKALFAPDPVRDREVKRVRALWRRLRAMEK